MRDIGEKVDYKKSSLVDWLFVDVRQGWGGPSL